MGCSFSWNKQKEKGAQIIEKKEVYPFLTKFEELYLGALTTIVLYLRVLNVSKQALKAHRGYTTDDLS